MLKIEQKLLLIVLMHLHVCSEVWIWRVMGPKCIKSYAVLVLLCRNCAIVTMTRTYHDNTAVVFFFCSWNGLRLTEVTQLCQTELFKVLLYTK